MRRPLGVAGVAGVAALLSAALPGCDFNVYTLISANFTTPGQAPAIPFALSPDAIVLPIGIAAQVHIDVMAREHHESGGGDRSDETSTTSGDLVPYQSFTAESLNPKIFDIKTTGSDFILYGEQLGLSILRISPAGDTSSSNGDNGEVLVPVLVANQDGTDQLLFPDGAGGAGGAAGASAAGAGGAAAGAGGAAAGAGGAAAGAGGAAAGAGGAAAGAGGAGGVAAAGAGGAAGAAGAGGSS